MFLLSISSMQNNNVNGNSSFPTNGINTEAKRLKDLEDLLKDMIFDAVRPASTFVDIDQNKAGIQVRLSSTNENIDADAGLIRQELFNQRKKLLDRVLSADEVENIKNILGANKIDEDLTYAQVHASRLEVLLTDLRSNPEAYYYYPDVDGNRPGIQIDIGRVVSADEWGNITIGADEWGNITVDNLNLLMQAKVGQKAYIEELRKSKEFLSKLVDSDADLVSIQPVLGSREEVDWDANFPCIQPVPYPRAFELYTNNSKKYYDTSNSGLLSTNSNDSLSIAPKAKNNKKIKK